MTTFANTAPTATGRYGATAEDWRHLVQLGLTADLLPAVSNPNVPTSPQSKVREADRGKVPSRINGHGVVGFSAWTNYVATAADIFAWSQQPDYGICVQTRRVRALDVDVQDSALAAEIHVHASLWLGQLPCRCRPNSSKFLLAFGLTGEYSKRLIITRAGRIELLATGQQFIAAGTHPTGVRYEWRNLPASTLPTVTAERLEGFWQFLTAQYEVGAGAPSSTFAPSWVDVARDRDFTERDTWFEPLPDEQKHAEVRAIARTWTDDDATDRDRWLLCLHSIGDAIRRGLDSEAGFGIASEFSRRTTRANLANGDEIRAKLTERGHARASIYAAATVARRAGYLPPHERPPAIVLASPAVPLRERFPAIVSPVAADYEPAYNLRTNQLKATVSNLEYALASMDQFRYDEFAGRVMVRPIEQAIWRALADADITALRGHLERALRFEPVSKETLRDVIQRTAERFSFDSAAEWLASCTWNGVPRVDRFLADYCGSADDEYTRAVSRYIWTGLAGRVLSPGCQLDMVPALISPQGRKKSTGLQAMSPDPEFFTDGLDLHEADSADFKRALKGKLVVELSEMVGFSKTDVELLKRAITRRDERWIEKWQTTETRYLRRCMFFASTNNVQCLPLDETGQRRWLPVEIAEFHRERIAADRDQLWAEGAAIYQQSGVAWQDAERLAEARHARHELRDVWEPLIAAWLVKAPVLLPGGGAPLPPPCMRQLTVTEVLAGAIGMRAEQMNAAAEKRAGRVLRQLGYESRVVRVDGAPVRRWARA